MKKLNTKQILTLAAAVCTAGFLFVCKPVSSGNEPLAAVSAEGKPLQLTQMKKKGTNATNFGVSKSAFPAPASSAEENKNLAEQAEAVLKKTHNLQRFIENKGQLPSSVKYYSDASGVQLAVTDKSIRIIAHKYEGKPENLRTQSHIVDLSFEGSNLLKPQPVAGNIASYNFMTSEETMQTGVQSYGELLLPEIYDGVSLRLYSNETGDVEFDWLVTQPENYRKIKMKFNGQDYLKTTSKGELAVGLRFDEMKLHIPESYQVTGREKRNVNFSFTAEDGTAAFDLAKNETLVPGAPLVIDPAITYATLFAGDPSVLTHYLTSAVAKDPAGNIYAGMFCYSAKITSAYINNAPGYDQTGLNTNVGYPFGQHITCIAKISGNTCTAFTFFGSADGITSLKLFPDGRVLFGGFVEAATGNLIPATPDAYIGNPRPVGTSYMGMLGVLSADLTTLHYATYLPSIYTNSSSQSGVSFLEIMDDDTYFVGSAIMPGTGSVPSGFINSNAPDIDPNLGSYENYIARFSSYNTKNWATYIGGSSIDFLGGLKLTPDRTKLAFCGQTFSATGWPALTGNNVGSAFIGTNIFLGTLSADAAPPQAFDFLSFFGGNVNIYSPKMDVSNNRFYLSYTVFGAASLPGSANANPAVYDGTANGGYDFAVTTVPINGTSSGIPVRTTYLGGTGYELTTVGIAANETLDKVYFVGSTYSTNYPTVDLPGSSYFKGTMTPPTGNGDLVISVLNTDLTELSYSSFLGGEGIEVPWTLSNTDFTPSNTTLDYDVLHDQLTCIVTTSPNFQGGTTNGFGPILGPDSFDPEVQNGLTIPFIFTFDGGDGAGCPGAGTVAPQLLSSTVANTCPATTANLNLLPAEAPPAGGTLVWYTNNTHTGAPYATPATAAPGIYYAFYYDAANNCYSPPATATVFINDCPCRSGGIAPPMKNYNPLLGCGQAAYDLTSLHTGVVAPGTKLLWFTNDTHTGLPYTNVKNAPEGTYYAFYYDALNGCFSPGSKVVIDRSLVCSSNDPDLTPTIDIDDLSFTPGQSRDFVLNIFEIVDDFSQTANAPAVVVRLNRLSGWDITVPGLALNSTAQAGADGTSSVYGGTDFQNSMFTFSQNANFITIVLKPNFRINSGGSLQLGFKLTCKSGTPANTIQNITATILDNAGGDIDNTNNQVIVSITSN